MDSLGAVELRNAVAIEFGISVPATLAFDYPTPAALSEFVTAHVPREAVGVQSTELDLTVAREVHEPEIDAADVRQKIHGIVCDVLGSSVSSDQPLMEVGLKLGHLE